MNFEGAVILLLEGKRIRRRGWRRGVSISYYKEDRFITMTVHFKVLDKDDIVRKWEPYMKDFLGDDWEVVADFVPKVRPPSNRVSRYRRDPVI